MSKAHPCKICAKTILRYDAERCRECYIKILKQNLPASAFKKGENVGEKHPNWKGGMWVWARRQVLSRDDHTCQVCFLKEEGIMDVAHIEPVKGSHKRRYTPQDIKNLVTLCPNDHRRFDRGMLNNKSAHLKSR